MFDVIIIGSGPAGLTAAIYTSRSSLKTLILAGKKWGGQLMLTTEVENFPGFPDGIMGPKLMANIRRQAERFGAKILDEEVTNVDFSRPPFKVYTGESSGEKIFSLTNSNRSSSEPFSSSRRVKSNVGASYSARSLIIATGADTVWLNIPGEQRLIGRGVSSCAPCDAFFYRNKKVIVVGGGDSAMKEALVLTKFASKVIVIHRRDQFRASAIMVDKVKKNPKIEIVWKTTVEEIMGDQKVEKVKLKSGDKVWEMPIDGVFVAIGHKPNTALFKDILDIDGKGYLQLKPITDNRVLKYSSASAIPGVFVAGDVHDYTYRQAITAAGFGCEAAFDVERWLEGEGVK